MRDGQWGGPHFARLTSLRCLGVAGTCIGDTTTKVLAGLTGIEMVNVSRTRVTDVGLMNLSVLTQLHAIEIRQTQTTHAGISRFRAKRPECIVVTNEGMLWPPT